MGRMFPIDGRKGQGGEPNQGVPEEQITLALGGTHPASATPGMGPRSFGVKGRIPHESLKPSTMSDGPVGDHRLPSGGSAVPGQLPKRQVSGDDGGE